MSSMSEEKFIRLVRQAEEETAANPRRYLVKLVLFAMLGYVVIFGVLLALLGLAGGLIAAMFVSTTLIFVLLKTKLIFIIPVAVWILLRALWVRFDRPEGRQLKRKEFPQLFAEIDQLCGQLQALKIHRVILSDRLNAGVVQYPRLGIFGWHRNYLIIGYPMLLALSPDEMRAVLAHEFGHLSGNHSRFHGWIYRVRLSWIQVMEAFGQAETWGARLMRAFFNWYSPKFEAYSFALARNNEYEADAIAAKLTSPEATARALVTVHATTPYIEEHYWQSYLQYADQQPEPPHLPFSGLANFLQGSPLPKEEVKDRIQAEMQLDTGYSDTHPSLKDRLECLVAEPPEVAPPKASAAQAWLGEPGNQIVQEFDRQWLDSNREAWRERFDYVANAREKLLHLDGREPESLSDEDLWNYARLSFEFVSDEQALPLFRVLEARYPAGPGPAFYLGSILLRQGDASGLKPLALARKDPEYFEDSVRLGFQFLQNQGDVHGASAWRQESIQQQEIFDAAVKERQGVGPKDTLVNPEIPDELLARVVASLNSQRKVGKVWLAQKPVQHLPEQPVYVIAFKVRGWTFSADKLQKRVAAQFEVDGNFFIACRSGSAKSLAKRVIKKGRRII